MKYFFTLILAATCLNSFAQFSFSGYIDADEWQNTVYLSLVDDYRKIDGVHSEQIIAKTQANTDGYFEFKGNMLNEANRIYRIHVDKCSENIQDINHFNGHCKYSKALIFIANNKDNLQLPFSFENQLFCNIISTNPKANAFAKIDSLKQDMRFAYGEFRSTANRKLNNIKWFLKLQDFSKSLNEPLAELYTYAYLSDRTGDLHDYYLKDLKTNNYYKNLELRLSKAYPNSNYTKQYVKELAADTFMLSTPKTNESNFSWLYVVIPALLLSLILNVFFIFQNRKKKKFSVEKLKQKLSKQERVVLNLLLQNKSNKDIAATLFVSVSTIKTHINNIYKKLEIQSREDAKKLFSNKL